MPELFTTREVAQQITESPLIAGAVSEWQVRRLFERGVFPEPPKFGGKRAIPSELIPAIVDALRARGWLPKVEATTR